MLLDEESQFAPKLLNRKRNKVNKKMNLIEDDSEEEYALENNKIKIKQNDFNNKNKVKKLKSLKISASKDKGEIEIKIVNKKVKKFKNDDNKKVSKIKKEKIPKANKNDLEANFDYQGNYFYQKITEKEWVEIDEFFKAFFKNKTSSIKSVKPFLDKFPNLKKGEDNINKFKRM